MYPIFLKVIGHIKQGAGWQNYRMLDRFIGFAAVSDFARIAQRDNRDPRIGLKITGIVGVKAHFAVTRFIKVEQAVVEADIKGAVQLTGNGNQRRMHGHSGVGHLSIVVRYAKGGRAPRRHTALPGNRRA